VFSASATTTDNEQSSLDNHKELRRCSTSSSSSGASKPDNFISKSSLPPPSEQQQHDSLLAKRKLIKSLFRSAKGMERQTRWKDASILYEKILRMDPYDSHSHLALARLEARREIKQQFQQESRNYPNSSEHAPLNSIVAVVDMATSGTTTDNNTSSMTIFSTAVNMANSKARMAFARGTKACPTNIHLKQAWAMFEESCGNIDRARELFLEALTLDERNSHACHALGLMEKKLGNTNRARELFTQALHSRSTAALVCSLGEVLIANKEFKAARDLYIQHLLRLEHEKDKTEVYLASAWLEERYFGQYDRAQQLIELALAHSPSSGLAQVALARLEGRIQQRNRRGEVRNYDERLPQDATMKRLANACFNIEKGTTLVTNKHDGRLYNTWANMEVRSRRLSVARKILEKGREVYPLDQSVRFDYLLCRKHDFCGDFGHLRVLRY
jgi:tetratricopeptide (TPR) repeat protein